MFFCASHQCFGFLMVDEAEGLGSCAKVDRVRSCHMGAVAVPATKLSLRLSLVNPVAQETRIAQPPSRQHKVGTQVDLGFPWETRGFTSVQETEVRGDQAVVGCSRMTQSTGSFDVHELLESFTSFKQRCRIGHTQKILSAPAPCGVKITAFRPLDNDPGSCLCCTLRRFRFDWASSSRWL